MKQVLFLLVLFLGCTSSSFGQHTDTPKYVMPAFGDTSRPVAPKSALELQWEEQTTSGASAVVEKATAGFFATGKNAGIYAFHNVASRGTILKVRNLNNDHVIFVKVLGPLPLTNPFKGCTLGLSNDAKAALGVRESKAFCEVSYLSF
jgi:hypothetical protein